jgi:acetyltransferase-like isoleucine patch superfamily enzyme
MVVDRHAVHIERGAVIGARAVIAGHLAVKDAAGAFRVTLAPVEIGPGALIGAYAGIAPGCSIGAGEEVPAASFLRPFTRWSGGRRRRPDRPRLA